MIKIKVEDIDLKAIKRDGLDRLLRLLKKVTTIEINDNYEWYDDECLLAYKCPWKLNPYIRASDHPR